MCKKNKPLGLTLGAFNPEPAKVVLTQVSFFTSHGLFLCHQRGRLARSPMQCGLNYCHHATLCCDCLKTFLLTSTPTLAFAHLALTQLGFCFVFYFSSIAGLFPCSNLLSLSECEWIICSPATYILAALGIYYSFVMQCSVLWSMYTCLLDEILYVIKMASSFNFSIFPSLWIVYKSRDTCVKDQKPTSGASACLSPCLPRCVPS